MRFAAFIIVASMLMSGFVCSQFPRAQTQALIEIRAHAPITIVGDLEFNVSNGVIQGTGSASDPYVIDGFEINASSGIGISISNTTAHFVISDVSVHSGAKFVPGPGLMWPSYDGIQLSNVTNCTLQDLWLSKDANGIYVTSSSHVSISRCNLTGNEEGLLVTMSDNVTVAECGFHGQIWSGISLQDSVDVKLTDSTFIANYYGGIECSYSSRMLIANNSLERTGEGLAITSSEEVTVEMNRFEDNERTAISIRGSSSMTILQNLIKRNANGIRILDSKAIIVYQNDFVENTLQAYDSGASGNSWDNGTRGNYWSDYQGRDTDGDGIGESAYTITTGVEDSYPSIHPVSGLLLKGSVSVSLAVTIIGLATAILAVVLVALILMARKGRPKAAPAVVDSTGGT